MASSAFSFHCMICFEEFDPDNNYPVVLPCGHTYVCITCANRLDKCMECREPLLAPIEPTQGHHSPNHQKENRHRHSPGLGGGVGNGRVLKQQQSRYHRHQQQQPPPAPPPPRKRLPLPKNVVLLSLIQASEPARRRSEALAAPMSPLSQDGCVELFGEHLDSPPRSPPSQRRDDSGGGGERRSLLPPPQRAGCPSPLFSDDCGDEYDDEEQKIRVGTHVANGACGTYAVATKEGLGIYPTLPEDFLSRHEEDVETLVKKSYNERARRRKSQRQQEKELNQAELQLPILESSNTWVEDHEGVHEEEGGVCVEAQLDESPMQPRRSLSFASRGSSRGSRSSCGSEKAVIRLEYGDRVQVVSREAGGWVRLARGYGYIHTENFKQLVKVGGTNDMACQLEAVLHELSLERLRLKQEQKQLERVAAGLMIDLQSSLLVDNDLVVVPAPVGMPQTDPELPFMLKKNRIERQMSKDDISVRSRSNNSSTSLRDLGLEDEDIQRTIRPVKSESPSRLVHRSPNSSSPAQMQLSTPTRVNFRTGLSGHRGLAIPRTHPHDFLEATRDPQRRSMSSHSGLTPQKSAVKVPPRVQGKRSMY